MVLAGQASLLGEATLRLGPAPRPPATTWLPLVSPVLPVPRLGELMFSISYLPTAERLTLVVVKARNLRGNQSSDTKKAGDVIPGDFFVKVNDLIRISNFAIVNCLSNIFTWKRYIKVLYVSRFICCSKAKRYTKREHPLRRERRVRFLMRRLSLAYQPMLCR